MELQELIQYLDHYLGHQHCFRHFDKKAKVIKLSTALNEAFICSECIETDNQCQKVVSIKRASEKIRNFILYGEKQSQPKMQSITDQVNRFKQQLTSFYSTFNTLLENIQDKLKLRNEACEKQQPNFQKKLNDLQRSVGNYNKIQSLQIVDVKRQREESTCQSALRNSLIVLLQNDGLLATCNNEVQSKINEIFNNSIHLITNLISEQSQQLQQLIVQEDYLLNLIGDHVEPKNQSGAILTKSTFELYNSTKSQMFSQMVSSYSSQLGAQSNWLMKPESVHPSFELKNPQSLHFPFDHQSKHQQGVLRLALISPIIQEGPLKQPRSITFQIDQQIRSTFAVGICRINPKDLELEIAEESYPYVFFTSQGTVINREIQAANQVINSPNFTRGDTITITLKPQTNFIQIVKNKMHNQPFQFELPTPRKWQWMNLCFVVAAQSAGGGDIQILN